MTQTANSPTPHTTIRPSKGWANLELRELWQFRDLLLALAARDVKLRYKQTALGIAWVIFQPLLAAGIFTLVFGVIAQLPSGGLPYFVFAYAGQLAWATFSNTFSKAGASMVASSHLVSKVYFPRLILPLSTLASTLLDFAVAMIVMIGLMFAYRIAPTAAILTLPFWLAIILLLAIGCGLIAAALMVSYRDVQYILPVLLPLLMYASPVAYSLNDALARLPGSLRPWLALNPLSSLLEGFRWSILGTAPPDAQYVAYSLAVSIAVCFFGAVVFRRMERRFADVI
ncbi:MAG: ABC transporter permease [Anaerolineae bacterium]|nr:ABC transporter permease [Phycisphaerae bacterium]